MTPLQKMLTGGPYAKPAHILEALTAERARSRPAGVAHSVYEELWHLDYWQKFLLARIAGEEVVAPDRAYYGWPNDNDELSEETWRALIEQVLGDLERAVEVAGDTRRLARADKRGVSARDRLESLMTHNAYHFGRMVLVRQLLSAWPPPSGGDTW